jgi:hypothetical protein
MAGTNKPLDSVDLGDQKNPCLSRFVVLGCLEILGPPNGTQEVPT